MVKKAAALVPLFRVDLSLSAGVCVVLGQLLALGQLPQPGDALGGSRSVAVVLGPVTAMRVAAGIFGGVVILSGAPFVLGWLSWHYMIPLGLLDGIIVISTLNLLNPHRANRLTYIRAIYLGGLAVLVLFIILRLTVHSFAG